MHVMISSLQMLICDTVLLLCRSVAAEELLAVELVSSVRTGWTYKTVSTECSLLCLVTSPKLALMDFNVYTTIQQVQPIPWQTSGE